MCLNDDSPSSKFLHVATLGNVPHLSNLFFELSGASLTFRGFGSFLEVVFGGILPPVYRKLFNLTVFANWLVDYLTGVCGVALAGLAAAFAFKSFFSWSSG